jgi:hypothetical protein
VSGSYGGFGKTADFAETQGQMLAGTPQVEHETGAPEIDTIDGILRLEAAFHVGETIPRAWSQPASQGRRQSGDCGQGLG